MTIRELYNWAQQNEVEDFEIEIQDEDCSTYSLDFFDVDINYTAETVII